MTTTMLYDLNIPWTPSTTPADLDRTLSFASHLGYSVVALSHTLPPPIPSPIPNPLPLIPPTTADRPTVLRRVTVPMSDPSTNHRLPQLAASYDVVAVRPTTERAFLAACTSLSADHFSLISLDLAAFFPFHFPPRACMAAVARGLRFEICHGQFLGARRDDARARANFLANVAGLVRATKGRGVVVSSEAGGVLGLRAAPDVVNLLAVWGLGTERGMEALSGNPRGVVVNEGIRRRGFRGVVDVVGAVGPDRGQAERGEEGGGKKKKQKGEKEKQGQGKEKEHQGQKRRSEEGDDDTEAGGGVPVSKRQAKKMRLAARNAKSDKA